MSLVIIYCLLFLAAIVSLTLFVLAIRFLVDVPRQLKDISISLRLLSEDCYQFVKMCEKGVDN